MRVKVSFVPLVLLMVISNSCSKEKRTDDQNLITQNKDSLLIWRVALTPSGELANSIRPIINSNEDILLSYWGTSSSWNREKFRLFDRVYGIEKWHWDDYLKDEYGFSGRSHLVFQNSLVLCSWNATYSMNMETGLTQWKHYFDTMYGSPHITGSDNGFVYHGFSSEKDGYAYYLFRTPHDQLDWQPVLEYRDSTKTFENLTEGSMQITKSMNGDDLIIFSLLNGGSMKNLALLLCFNITQDKYEWIRDYSSIYTNFTINKSVLDNGRMFMFALGKSAHQMVAIEIGTGDILWDEDLPDLGVDMISYQDKIIAFSLGERPILAFNKSSGSLSWKQEMAVNYPDKYTYTFDQTVLYKHYLVSAIYNYLVIMDANDGKVLFDRRMTDPGCLMKEGVAINEAKRCFYVQDGKYLNCYKFPDIIK